MTPERLREGGTFDPAFVGRVLDVRPHQRLGWHCFMLWQMIGLELWRELFIEG